MNRRELYLIILVLLALPILLYFTFQVLNKEYLKANFNKHEEVISKKENDVSFLNFGDVMFDRGVRNIMEKRGRDPFEYIKQDLSFENNYDVVIANLEGPIIEMDRDHCQQKAYNFQFASNTPELIKSAGINMVNIANNHSNDCFRVGFLSTKEYLQNANIDYIGDSDIEKSYVVKNINEKNVAFIGIDQTVSSQKISDYYPLIKSLKDANDLVVVDIHWGTEYKLEADASQIEAAHSLIDSGVDAVIGHHPHVIEPMEIYKNKLIVYSLGNFVFDQSGENETQGIGVGVKFAESSTTVTIMPYKILTFAPDFLKDEERDAFCNEYLKSYLHDGCSLNF